MSCMGLYIRQNVAPAHEVDNLLGQQHQIGIQIQIDISRRGVFLLPADWFFSSVTLRCVYHVDIGRCVRG